jgi:hypothetical protein
VNNIKQIPIPDAMKYFDDVIKIFDELYENKWLFIGLIILILVGVVLIFKA